MYSKMNDLCVLYIICLYLHFDSIINVSYFCTNNSIHIAYEKNSYILFGDIAINVCLLRRNTQRNGRGRS